MDAASSVDVQVEYLESREMADKIRQLTAQVEALLIPDLGSPNYKDGLQQVKNTLLIISKVGIAPEAKKQELLQNALKKMGVDLPLNKVSDYVVLIASERAFVDELDDGATMKPNSGSEARNVMFCQSAEGTMQAVFKFGSLRCARELAVYQAACQLGSLGDSVVPLAPSVMPSVKISGEEESAYFELDDDKVVESVRQYGAYDEEANKNLSSEIRDARGLVQKPIGNLCTQGDILFSSRRDKFEGALDKRSFQNACMLNMMFGLRDQKMHSLEESNFLFRKVSDDPLKLEIMLFDLDVPSVGYVDRAEVKKVDIEAQEALLGSEIGDEEKAADRLPASSNCALMGLSIAQEAMSVKDCLELATRTLSELKHKDKAIAAFSSAKIPLGKEGGNLGNEVQVVEEEDPFGFGFEFDAEEGELDKEAEPVGTKSMHTASDVTEKKVAVFSEKQVSAVEKRMTRIEGFMKQFVEEKKKFDRGEKFEGEFVKKDADSETYTFSPFSMYDLMGHVCPDYKSDFEEVRDAYSGNLMLAANSIGEATPKSFRTRL